MTTLRNAAEKFESSQTIKNVADLENFDIDKVNIETRTFATGTDKEFQVTGFEHADGDFYRVPNSVIGQIKTILEKHPAGKHFEVIKSGTGLNTQYTTMLVSNL